MDAIVAFFGGVSSLGVSVVMPIVLTILGVLFGAGFGKSLKAGLTVGIGFIGLNLVINQLMGTDLAGGVNAMVTRFSLSLSVMDVGWPAASAIAMGSIVGTIIIQQAVYTFISPKIMASSVDIHPALTLIALVAGSAIGGAMSGFTGSLVGMLASIPAVAVMKSVFVYYFEKQTGRQLVAEDGVFFQGTPRSDGSLDPIADATSPHPDASTGFSLPKVGRGKEQRRDGDRQ